MRNLGPVEFKRSTQWVYDPTLTLVSALMHCQSALARDSAELSHAVGIVALGGSLFFWHHFSALAGAGLCGSALAQLRLKAQSSE